MGVYVTNPTTISRAPACAGVNAAPPASTVSTGVGGGNFRLSQDESERHREDLAVDDEINRRRMGRHFESQHWGI